MLTDKAIIDLKHFFPEEDWPWVFKALRRDQHIWLSLMDSEFRDFVSNELGEDPQIWSPAHIALLALSQTGVGSTFGIEHQNKIPTPETLRETPLQSLNSDLRQKALQALDDLQDSKSSPNDLPSNPIVHVAYAGLLSLALRERFRLTGSWNDFQSDLFELVQFPWNTALACFYGILPKPTELLSNLSAEIALYTLFANPQPPDDRLVVLQRFIKIRPKNEIPDLLYRIQTHDRNLARSLALWIIEHIKDFDLTIDKKGNTNTHKGVRSNLGIIQSTISDLQIDFTLHKIHHQAEKRNLAIEHISTAQKNSKNLQNNLTFLLAQTITQNEGLKIFKKQWNQILAEDFISLSPENISQLVVILLTKDEIEEAKSILENTTFTPEEQQSPVYNLANAILAEKEKNWELARDFANVTLHAIEGNRSLPEDFPDLLAQLLYKLNLHQKSIRATKIALRAKPNDPVLLELLARSQFANQQFKAAIESIHIAIALAPKHLDYRRLLCEMLESRENWDASLKEHNKIVELSQEELENNAAENLDEHDGEEKTKRHLNDLLAYAKCALKAQKPQKVVEICKSALEADPDEGLFHTLLGEAYSVLGDLPTAYRHFEKSTVMSPHIAEPWLALARAKHLEGDQDRVLEILQKAVQAAPKEPEIYLALGKYYSEKKAQTEALTAYKQAAELTAHSERGPDDQLNLEIALQLGITLNSLGHYQEAQQVLESAHIESPSNPDIAYELAQALLKLNNPNAALVPLIETLRSNPQYPAPYLDYAGALLDTGESPDKAISAIRKALEIEPDHLEALAMLPEALAANGELKAAVDAYRQALESDLHTDPNWSPRLYLGLGRASLELGLPDVALATLQQGIQADPENLEIAHTIVDAYQKAELLDRAKQAAQNALKIAPEDIDNLIWFSEKAHELEVPDRAIQALRDAIAISPQRIDLLVHVGEIQKSSGDRNSAKDTFSEIASTEYAKIPDLRIAAKQLIELDEAEIAVKSLNRAINLWEETTPKGESKLDDLWYELASAYHHLGNNKEELNALEQAISISPERTDLYASKASLLVNMGQTQAALDCLREAINITPGNPEFHYRSAHVYRKKGNLVEAFNEAQQAVDCYSKNLNSSEALAARGLAAEMACALLQEEQAYSYLEIHEAIESIVKKHHEDDMADPYYGGDENYQKLVSRDLFGFHTLRAELSLKGNDEIIAANAITAALKLNPSHPRTQALRSRLSARHGDFAKANRILEGAMESLGKGLEGEEDNLVETSDFIAVSEATLELLYWDEAIYLLGKVKNNKDQGIQTPLKLARSLVLRAEAQRLYQRVDAIKHSPGESGLSSEAYQSLENALQLAEKLVDEYPINLLHINQADEVIDGQIKLWKARGQAIFNPNPSNIQKLVSLPSSFENQAAYLSSLLEIQDMDTAAKVASNYYTDDDTKVYSHPKLLAYIALALIENDPGISLKAIEEAIQEVKRKSSPNEAIYYALQSQIALSLDDDINAYKSMDLALKLWEEEPRWHAQIAEIIRELHPSEDEIDISTGISHLQKATHLEPENANHHLALGELLISINNTEAAIEALERAKHLSPDSPNVWLGLAKAHRLKQNPDKAIQAAQRAVEFASDQVEPHLLLAEIALDIGNPQKSRQEAEIVLGIDPENPDGILILSRALVKLDQSIQAINILESAIQASPNSLELALERVYLLRGIHGPEAALDTISELVERYPSNERVLTTQAEILADNGKTEEALQTARGALNLDKPNGIDPEQRAKIYRLMGGLERRKGQLDQAVHNLNEAIHIMPDWPDPYLELGHTYLDRRQHDQALQTYQQAISIAPKDPRPYYHAGLVLKDVKDYLEAEVMLRRAADLAPNDLRIHRQLGAMVALNIVHNRNQVSLPGLNNG